MPKINALPLQTSPDASDVFPTDDVSDSNNTKKVTLASLLALVYPVGSIYTNAAVSTNPATLLGFGTWTAFAAGRVLVGIDGTQTEFDVLGETGGAKTHTLTGAEMQHTNYSNRLASIVSAGGNFAVNATETGTVATVTSTAHNNLQPYITVYMWKRTA
jgi:microcystin-dependent protein